MHDADLDNTAASDLARIIGLGTEATPQWGDQDLTEMFAHQLSASLMDDLQNLNGVDLDQLYAWVTSVNPPITTFGDLFFHANPPIELLKQTKEYAKACRDDVSCLIPDSIASTLYYACLAVGRTRCGIWLTTMSPAAIRQGFRWAVDQPWVEPDLRSIFTQALEMLKT